MKEHFAKILSNINLKLLTVLVKGPSSMLFDWDSYDGRLNSHNKAQSCDKKKIKMKSII